MRTECAKEFGPDFQIQCIFHRKLQNPYCTVFTATYTVEGVLGSRGRVPVPRLNRHCTNVMC